MRGGSHISNECFRKCLVYQLGFSWAATFTSQDGRGGVKGKRRTVRLAVKKAVKDEVRGGDDKRSRCVRVSVCEGWG